MEDELNKRRITSMYLKELNDFNSDKSLRETKEENLGTHMAPLFMPGLNLSKSKVDRSASVSS